MKILIFGGTTEGRILAGRLAEMGADVTVSVATPLGAEELSSLPEVHVAVGRLSQEEMENLLLGFDFCIDVTHPYAAAATENILRACGAAQVPLRRLLREKSGTEGCLCFPSCASAAEYLQDRPGNVLIATGAKELPAFASLESSRLYARILPTHEGLAACEALGLRHRNILAMQGPFSQKLNEAILEQYQIAYLVTKDGGRAGGFDEKRAAAQHAGAQLILIVRPVDAGTDLETILKEMQEMMRCL